MKSLNVMPTLATALLILLPAPADCPLDHLLIGCNQDGIVGTEDDKKLFVDCAQKYRHSDPEHSGDPTWLNWYYPLYYNERYDRYQIGEPGFDIITEDRDRSLAGVPDVDYRIMIECVSITPGFAAKNTTLDITLDEAGDSFNHNALSDSHLHLQYRAPNPAGATELHWITYQLYDAIADGNQYESAEPITVVFVTEPLSGDLVVDGVVDMFDLTAIAHYWRANSGANSNDYYERADADRNGLVDFTDLAILASNWLCSAE
ncbi:MAG: hypothetical protein JXN61_16355 [Sedimentisphaerales bacterium]|nr:hypothetical protein [Sedimentisphaerales bacterium]